MIKNMKTLYLRFIHWYLYHVLRHYLGVTYDGSGRLIEVRDYYRGIGNTKTYK